MAGYVQQHFCYMQHAADYKLRTVSDHILASIRRAAVHDYLTLCKPKIVAMIVFTAVVGMFLSTPAMVPPAILLWGSLGIWLAAASAAVINHVVDQKIDSTMARTRNRPLPKGRVTLPAAILFSLILGVAAMLLLTLLVNSLTAILTLLSLIAYSFIYSMYLKRATPQNIVIGGVAGAAPPVLGWTAVTGTLDADALLLFLIIFAWTPPHFWSLAVTRRHEYEQAEIPMLPVTHGAGFTRNYIVLYTVILFMVSLLPVITWMSGMTYLAGAVVLGAGFLYQSVRMLVDTSDRQAMQTFSYSIFYLMALFSFLLLDHYMPAIAENFV
jgi:protoheme IX farnesyltransferase